MAFIGRLHPLLIHFPIALVVVAALAEFVAMVTADERWRPVAVANLRAGAGFALLAALATGSIRRRLALGALTYRTALFAAGTLVAVTGHLGGLLVWGANFLRP